MSTTTEDATTNSAIDRSILESRLASLLGFDDISDIFEHLISIDTSQHLEEYLSDLLGNVNQNVKTFVLDVGKFKMGERIRSTKEVEEEKTESKVDEVKEERDYSGIATTSGKGRGSSQATTRNNQAKMNKQKKRGKGSVERGKKQRETMSTKKVQPIESVSQQTKEQQQPKTTESQKKLTQQPKQQKNARKKSPVPEATKHQTRESNKPRKPRKGKANAICGCFGTKHKALTNCLHCGRISCEYEGYGYCPFCGYLIEEMVNTVGQDSKLDRALIHKERLLEFDREFAQRTVVYDDQEDYFSNARSEWLTEEEKRNADEKEKDRRDELFGRKKIALNIAFD